MTMLVLILILIPIGLIAASIKSKGKTRKILLLLLTVTLLIPICLILLIKPAQQGKILPQWGKISLLFSEPEDLWQPLAEVPLEQNKNIYTFTLFHKYVGMYDVEILFFDKNIDIWGIDKNELKLTIAFYDEAKTLFSKATSYVGGFKGSGGNGLTYIRYSLPEDLPINKELTAKIEISGNIEEFIKKYGNAKMIIKKGSDL